MTKNSATLVKRPGRALAGPLLAIAIVAGRASGAPLIVWPGYSLELPTGYCVELRRGPDFSVRYLRTSAQGPVLVGIYAGMAPRFEPDCAKPAKRSWTSRGLAFESVRDNGSCAEFLVHDPKKSDRGFLHVWYGPDAKEHPRLAEGLVESIRPAPPGSESSESPACP